MYDPDAPGGSYIHWLVSGTVTYVPYAPPTPPSGIHHYVFRLVEGEPSYIPKRSGVNLQDILPGRVKGKVFFLSE